jgi:hypothetical protein
MDTRTLLRNSYVDQIGPIFEDKGPDAARGVLTKFQAFWLSCGFARLKGSGFYEDVANGDPFDPDGEVSVKLTEEAWPLFRADPSKHDAHMVPQKLWSAV